jgi:hypothetical protein
MRLLGFAPEIILIFHIFCTINKRNFAGDIFFAYSNHAWILEGANVHIARVVRIQKDSTHVNTEVSP